MWFKNARLYCLNEAIGASPEEIEKKLIEQIFHPCSSHDKSKYGWISPLGKQGEMLTHVQGDYIMLCAQKQERLLPSSVVNEATDEKVAELEERQGRKIYRKEKRQIKDDVFVSLLPRAFTRNQQTFAYISAKDNLIVVNSASAPKAEALLSLLREGLGTLKVSIPDASDHFLIDEDCELYNPTDGSNIVRCKGQDLFSDEIQSHLEAGKQVKNLGVTWNSLLSCSLSDDLSIKRLKFVGMKQEEANEEIESAAQKFDQEFAVMTLELSNFFKSFFAAFGGLQDPKG